MEFQDPSIILLQSNNSYIFTYTSCMGQKKKLSKKKIGSIAKEKGVKII